MKSIVLNILQRSYTEILDYHVMQDVKFKSAQMSFTQKDVIEMAGDLGSNGLLYHDLYERLNLSMGRADNVVSSIAIILFSTANKLNMPIKDVFRHSSHLIYFAMMHLCRQSDLWRFEGPEVEREIVDRCFFKLPDLKRARKAEELLQISERKCFRYLLWNGQNLKAAVAADDIFVGEQDPGVSIIDAMAIANRVRKQKPTALFTISVA